MRTAYTLLALTLLPLLSALARGQNVLHELHGKVFSIENGEQAPQFFPNVQITILEFGASGRTDDQGLFRIQLPANVLSGQEVTLRHDKKGYAICFPLLGKQIIPADLTRPVEIRLLPVGSKLFWTHERIEEFIARTAGESAKKPPGRPGEATDLSAYILELGRHYGFTADEVRQEIGKWMEVARKDVTDFRRQGMVAFAEKNFRLAGENFRRSAEEMEQQAAKKLRASAADRELSGDSFLSARDYRQALQQYRHALTLLKTYKDSLGPLGIKTYPEHTVDVQRLTFESANAKIGLGERVAGPDSRRHLEDAVREYQRLIAQVPRSSNPRQWAWTQNNLGSALWALGQRLGGPEGLRRLNEAVEACYQALTVRTRNDLPQDWALTQNNLGLVLWALGQRQGGPEGLRRLNEAVAAYHQALTVRTRDDLPQDWARTQNNLGLALGALGQRQSGPEGLRRLGEAVGAYRQALIVRTRDELPQDWALTQNNLGNTLTELGSLLGGPEGLHRLGEAVDAYRLALTVFTGDDLPQQWAMTQKNLGNALCTLGLQLGGPEGLRRVGEAVDACRHAFTVFTHDDLPQDWAMTQTILGRALHIQILLGGFPAGRAQVDRLAQADGLRDDPVAQASLGALAIVCLVATHQDAEASRAFASLVTLVERQPADFHLVWDWTLLRFFLTKSDIEPIKTRRESLLRLLDAVSRDNKAAILADLKEVQEAFAARAEEPEIPIRQPPPQGRGVPAGPGQRP